MNFSDSEFIRKYYPKIFLIISILIIQFVVFPAAKSFCGFYVAKADTQLFNKASKVVLTRKDNKTVITMANDFKGDPKEFAVVVPVPTFLKREQIHVTDNAIIDHLDAYTAPRLVEYFDNDPCEVRYLKREAMSDMAMPKAAAKVRRKNLGVKVEAEYTVGEYDIKILSAKESDGLQTWLKENGYKVPEGASKVLGSYIKQKMRFFVAKVNLEEQSQLGFSYLRPLQIAFESPKFMLPIRLGTLNADGYQELFVFALTSKGRVETTNYRTVKIPSDKEIPVYIKEEFSDFYKAMFSEAVKKDDMRTVFLEYAWDMNWCDPCAADPLSDKELKELGVFWTNNNDGAMPVKKRAFVPSQAKNVFVTRLHVRYNAEKFPEDLMFQETTDQSNFQGRYILRHPWTGEATCDLAKKYKQELVRRQDERAKTLASLTGWDITKIRSKMKIKPTEPRPWWETLWGN